MSQEVLRKVQSKYVNKKVPDIKSGLTIEVDTIIRDGDKQRMQKFKGLVISVKGSGTGKTFTVRKISNGVGVEKTFPIYSTNISAIKVLKEEKVRRSKLYFMRDRVGKSAMRVRKGRTTIVVEGEEPTEEEMDSVELASDSTDETPVEKNETSSPESN